jgi:uncharacterized protein (TIGR02246 family)
MGTSTTSHLISTGELEQFVIGYWRDVDFNKAANVANYYTEDCTLTSKGVTEQAFKGHDGVKSYYAMLFASRSADRIVRHTVTNIHITADDVDHAVVDHFIITYAKAGSKPVQGFTGPTAFVDVRLTCRRSNDGKWRIAKFEAELIFVGS